MTEPLHRGRAGLLLTFLLAAQLTIPHNSLQAQKMAIVIQPGTNVRVSGGFTNLKNTNLFCNGNWQSFGGEILFTGASSTTAGGTGTINFWTMQIAKSETVPLRLTASLQVANALTLTHGLIDLNGQTLQLSGTARIAGENDSARITGLNGGKVVAAPITANAPYQLNVGNLGAVLSSSANLRILAVNRSPLPASGAGIGIQRTYLIQPENNTALNATLRLYYLNAELNGNDPTKLNLWKSTDGISWALMGADLRDTAARFVEKTGITDLSYWTLSSLATALPVKLTRFSAICTGTYALIEWQTGAESQLNRFQVERSTDGTSWLTIGSLPAKNVTDGASYSFKDPTPQPHSFYRLKIEDRNGTITYSPLFRGGCSDIALPFLVYPNPAVSQVLAQVSVRQAVRGKVQVLNVAGAAVYEAEWNLQTGLNQLVIPLAGWPSGTYLLRLLLADGIQTTQFIKL